MFVSDIPDLCFSFIRQNSGLIFIFLLKPYYIMTTVLHKEKVLRLENHLMRELLILQLEIGRQVTSKTLAIWAGFDGVQNLLVDGHLIFHTLVRWFVVFLLLVEDASVFRSLGADPSEVSVVNVGVQADFGNVQLRLGGDHVTLVDATHGATVHFPRSSYQQEARVKLLQENNSLSLMTSSQKDDNCTWSEGATELLGVPGGLLFSVIHRLAANVVASSTSIFGGVEARPLALQHLTGASVLVTFDLLLHRLGGLFFGSFGLLAHLLHLVDSSLLVHGTLGETHNTRWQCIVAGLSSLVLLRFRHGDL
ncbi:hypothetical protein RvY_14543 [Ramazzottius varieornatus]|uniref:Uncharacterized protein n=1 Tax=Ramazzottius varieornatus TaxID=947166 RepID=A0A1D1VRN9_RAMVA|nr:hypothetical protein RvY_14543 [Ramazzottius varieornatus]